MLVDRYSGTSVAPVDSRTRQPEPGCRDTAEQYRALGDAHLYGTNCHHS